MLIVVSRKIITSFPRTSTFEEYDKTLKKVFASLISCVTGFGTLHGLDCKVHFVNDNTSAVISFSSRYVDDSLVDPIVDRIFEAVFTGIPNELCTHIKNMHNAKDPSSSYKYFTYSLFTITLKQKL